MTQDMNHTLGKALRAVFVAAMMSLTGSHALAEDTQSSTGTGVHVMGNVFGGGNLAEVKGRVTVNIKAGTVVNDVYGGGAKANTNSSINTITQEDGKDVYPTTVNLTGGTIGNAYGGGLGEKAGVNGGTEDKEALVYGDVLVNVNGTAFTQEFDTYQEGTGEATTTVQVPKTGRVFGCNNLNGSPQKTVTVHVYKTVPVGGGDHQTGVYEIAAVYGGGNEAAYEPTISETETDASHAHTNVIVDGCSLTSIKQVYGGGNAASTPSTQVTINGAFEIDEVFGGGNGNDKIKRTSGSDVSWLINPGANVGFEAYDADSEDYDTPGERETMAYGFGKAQVNIGGGNIHAVYGGSNAKGNVRMVAVAMLEKTSEEDCFTVDEAYGGGKAAPMDGRAELQLGCIPGVGTVYGGARAAAVNNDVVLTITNGTYNNVFGGNNESGTINGSITINVEETGCRPIHIGNLYGGGNLASYTTPSGKNGPKLNIKSFTSIDHVYGGGFGAGADVTGDVTVNINVLKGRWAGKTVYGETVADALGTIGDVYGGGYGADVIGNVEVNIGTEETIGFVTEPTYLGSGNYSYNSTTKLYKGVDGSTNVVGAIITGNVFGGGFGAETTVTGDVAVNVGGQKADGAFIGNITIGGSTNGGNVYGGSALGAVNAEKSGNSLVGTKKVINDPDDNTQTIEVSTETKVTLKKGNIAGAVFGGGKGEAGTTSGARAVDGNLGAPASSGTAAKVYGNTTVTLYGDVVAGGLYGGCDVNGEIFGNTELNLYGGTVGTALAEGESAPDIVFGGGLGKATKVDGNVTVNVGNAANTGTTIYSNVYGGSAEGTVNSSASNTTTVNLFKGIIHGDVFGGGKGVAGQEAKAAVGTEGEPGYQPAVPAINPIPAYVKGSVRVNLNGYAGMNLEDETAFGTCVVTGNIFGCNNANGSPEGDVEVHIYRTVILDGEGNVVAKPAKNNSSYELTAVYGGGNEAAYTASGKTATVVIETCDVSVETVYGGGNAAKVPATRVDVNGAWEIGTVFGGGNGADDLSNGNPNPGADVDGTTYVSLQLGTIHEAYGGSNTKGVILQGSTMDVNDNSADPSDENACHLKVDKVYGGGKNAGMKGGTNIILRCQPDEWVEEIYAGSQMADVEGDVSLTITSGKFERVFGGNKTSGKIYGSITVNIEETGTCGTPIVIGELYGGGYQAKYSIYGYNENGSPRTKVQYESLKAQIAGKTDAEIEASDELKAIKEELTGLPYKQPQLNVRSFTSIGAIYGGGFEADMVADPTVNINVVEGSLNDDAAIHTGPNDTYPVVTAPATEPTTPSGLPYPVHTKGSIGVIGNVFGGGNLAMVDGSVTVNIGTESEVEMISLPKVDAVEGDSEYDSEAAERVKVYQKKTVLGANITENVYGGGNQADVTGNTQVNICVKKNASNVYENVAPGTAGVSIGGDVFGAGKGVNTDVTKALVEGNGIVKMGGGSVAKSVYGGGELSQVGGDTDITVSGGTIGTTGLGGAMYGNIYGGGFGSTDNVRFGLVKGDTYVTVANVVADATYAAAHYGVSAGDVISTPTVIHNIYGGGAYGSVGTFTYANDAADAKITGRISGGTAYVTVSGGTIGTTGQNNGMVFGSSRGDVGAPNEIHDRLAWVYDTHVTIGTSGQGTTPLTINGSVYGGGENGHNYHDAEVIVHSGTIGIHDGTDADGTRGNVYGGGCGTDKYYTGTIPDGHTANDGEGNKYNPLAGIVYGNATITMDGGLVKHNIYGAGAMGSVGLIEKNATTNAITIASGGTTTIEISGGTVGYDGDDNGDVFGAARGDKAFTDRDLALVNTTSVTISGSTQIKGNIYGGGEVGNVQTNTRVNIQGGAIAKNVFGGGKGVDNLFTCEQAMVGVDGEGAGQELGSVNKDKGTIVTISNGTVGTLNEGNLVEGTGNVYGGGEIGRVEWNTQVKIGVGTGEGTFVPTIYGNVFGAGKGLMTHGYSALVRGNSAVTIQGGAKIGENVYGGGEMSTVGRYWVKGINNNVTGAPTPPTDLPDGMPYQKLSGGICRVTIQGNAEIGTNNTDDKGHVFGAGKGVDSHFVASGVGASQKMVKGDTENPDRLVPFEDDLTTNKTAEQLYYEFLQTLALVTESHVTIDESAQVKGSVFGGSESGFVQTNTDVKIQGSGCVIGTTTYGNVFGGGKGLEYFAEAGKVKGNTAVVVSAGTIKGNVYGGGRLGDVGIIDKTDKKDGQLTYNYKWKQSDGVTANVAEYNIPSSTSIHDTSNNTGICKVTVSGGTIGLSSTNEPSKHGNVFGAGRGSSTTWWCEKAIAYATDVSVTKGTVYGNVYGGGEVGRVEDDAKVTIGALNGTDVFEIKGSVFGAGAGLATHGYSALVRGNAEVTVQGKAQVGGSVYGGGEIASVGRFHVVGGLPRNPQAGGTCTVKIQGNAKIGTSGTGHNVFGACKGVTPVYNNTEGSTDRSKSMQLRTNADKYYSWSDYNGDSTSPFIWVYYKTEDEYLDFLKTLALTSNTHVTIGGSSNVYGSVFGGGERGITLGGVDVNMTGGTVHEDVYGGGSLANSNTAMWDATNETLHDYVELELIPGLSHVTGYYRGENHELVADENAIAAEGEANSYSAIYKTNVNLKGGTIIGDAYGGGLGQKKYLEAGETGYVSPIEAMVYGDVTVKLNEGLAGSEKGCAVNRVFGCNNLNGTPKGKVLVHVYATQKNEPGATISNKTSGDYDVDAVYGGGNLSPYNPVDAKSDDETILNAARTEVIIDGCELTSIRQVYGGGNAASVPATFVEINGTYEIDEAFAGGNGYDNYSLNEGGTDVWYQNPGANVGYYDYTNKVTSGTSPGSVTDPYYLAVDDENFDTKDERLADNDAAAAKRYGSGIARLEVYGGTIHTSYGGSNSRGNVRTSLSSVYSANGGCPMSVGRSYGGGKNADSDGEVDMVADCAHGIKEMFGGSENADVDNDINLRITNGSSLERVFGGNNTSGAINGSITVTIEEGGCEPICIRELYLGGFLAPYSVYGYKKTGDVYDTEEVTYLDENNQKKTRLQRIPLKKGDDGALDTPRKDPCLYVISATKIDNIYGGGYQAKLVGNPHVNVNMKQGKVLLTRTGTEGAYVYKDAMGTEYIDNVISETTGEGTSAVTEYYALLPVGEIGNVYGGGNMADIVGDTYVEIGTGTYHNANGDLVALSPARNAANIKGNVFGGGKGKDDTFQCEKGMVGVNGDGIDHPEGGTYITIGNGTIEGNVYGGGEIGRVEKNTMVTIGLAAADVPEGLTSSPVIEGSVFGGGKGKETHGYAALVRGNPTVIIQGNAKVGHNVYGGGEIASVARYKVPKTEGEVAAAIEEGYDAVLDMPYALANNTSGNCKVIIRGDAEIGPDGMQMTKEGGPDDAGHVFGAGKGILPENYTYADDEHKPKRMIYKDDADQWEYFGSPDDYIKFIQTLALSSYTDVTIEGNAFVKGSVYGGSENGLVQYDTDVKITGNCQIGEGEGKNGRYTDSDWASESLAGCAHWDFDESSGAPYDPYAKYLNPADGKYYYDAGFTEYAEGGSNIAKDGHTYYGNVFGGGSGSVPYFDTTEGRSVYLNSAGTVKGNTKVTISGGHILTSVYGGCESTNVLGTSTVTMTAGTIGVPRTVEQIQAHPVICNLFGAGKGDQRVFFNKDTNVENAVVNVSGTAKIYGSVFGGGEDGHVLRNTKVTIGDGAIIGAFGYSGYDGNVFGGGRGFGGDALTAGNVSGDVEVNINGGSVLGSVYGGGRLASVGYGLYKNTEAGYGEMKDDGIDDAGNSVNGFTRGHVKVNITDGTIGNDTESTLTHTKGGNVFGGSMGRLTLLNGTTNPIWPKLARVKAAEVNIKGGTVKANVYGGGELGTVHTTSKVTVNKGTVNGSVFGGGYGSNDNVTKTEMDGVTYSAVQIAGRVDGTTTVEMNDGQVMKNLYGGGEMASVGVFTASDDMRTFTWGDPYNGTGVCNVTVAGGKIGTTAGSSSAGHVFGAGKGLEDTFWCEKGIVYSTNVNINKGTVNGNVYGGGEVGRVETDAIVKVEGTADIKGNVFGAGAGKETHGYSALVRGNTTVTVQGSAAVGKSVYGGGEIASVGKYGLDNKNMPSILMGGGYCYVTVQGNATVGADVFGAGEGVKSHFNNTDEDLSKRSRRMTLKSDWVSREGADRFDWDYLTESNYPTYLETLALATHPEVTIDGSASIGQSVYGGGELGLTKGSVIVNIKGGTITEDVYGGGSLANTNTTSTVGHTDADGNVTTETVHPTTTVNLLGGTVTRNVYGGGLGQKEVKTGETVTTPGIEAIVYGDVNVNLNGTTTITTDDATGNKTYTPSPNDPTKKGCVVKGNIFGANNVNGTPLGHVLVYVHGTQNETTSALNAKVDGLYDVTGVFGGGNASDYVPDEADTKQSTEVIIEGCDLTSIKEVYGGGYGAATPGTNVLIKGTKIIDNVYGGGYGAGTDNPGANVGFRTGGASYTSGDGKAVVQLMAGKVNNVYGGSNTKGDILNGSSVTNVANDGGPGCCTELSVEEIYGGGKNADMYGGAEICLSCMPNDWIGAIYAGAEEANVGHDISLTLTSGKFKQVYGGNKTGGKVEGSIEVNIEENPECSTPIIIGELYGGGNLAPYSIYGYYQDGTDSQGKPVYKPRTKEMYDRMSEQEKLDEGIHSGPHNSPRVNVRAFTSIGTIFGGGLGESAVMIGNPTVNINVVEGGRAYEGENQQLEDGTKVTLYKRDADAKIGVIGDVFGGGNAAKVIGNTTVNVGTTTEEQMVSLQTTDEKGNVIVIKKPVVGADIRGNVYGGGNNAEVTGHTNVVIGKKAE